MIIALEGYHGAGKSTLFADLKSHPRLATQEQISWIQFAKREWPASVSQYEYNVVELFTMLYDPRRIYIFDRLWPLTSVIYNRIRHIQPHSLVENPPWLLDVKIFRLTGGRCDQYEEEQYNRRLDELIEKGIPVVRLPLITRSGRVILAIEQIEKWYGSKL